jgi:hypothetical protein
MAGTCNYADRCNFAHGEAELRPWVPPALVSGTGPKIEETIWVGVRYPPHPVLPVPPSILLSAPFLPFPTPSFLPCPGIPRPTPHTARNGSLVPLGCSWRTPAVASLNDRSKTIRTANPVRSWGRAHTRGCGWCRLRTPHQASLYRARCVTAQCEYPNGVCGPTRSLRVP